MRLTVTARAVVVASLVVPAALAAQKSAAKPSLARDAESAAFVIRMGNDTLGVERYTRTHDKLEGQGVSRSPSTLQRSYSVSYDASGRVSAFTLHAERADRSIPPTQVDATFSADTANVKLDMMGKSQSMAIAARGGLPQLGPQSSPAMLESATQLAASKAESITVPMVFVGAPQAYDVTIRRVGKDSVYIAFPFETMYHAKLDRAGHILGLQGNETTAKITVERVKDVDIPALASLFAKDDASGKSVGVLSPADSVNASVGGAAVRIAYSQPALRGRKAVGGLLVPYGKVWRTGANAATTLETDRDLVIGSTTVPAGKYTLWTLPSADGWHLIVNKKTLDDQGQPLWGTLYDASQDFAHIDMTVSQTPDTAERFKITLEPNGNGGTLRLRWENTVATVPVAVKQ